MNLRLSSPLTMLLVAVVAAVVGLWLLIHGFTTVLASVVAMVVLLILFRVNRKIGIYAGLTFLIFLGDIRRIAALAGSFSANDPLVLVGPMFVVIVTLPILLKVRLRDTPSKLIFAIVVIMLLQVVNPGRGGLVAGVSGLILVLPPMLWFWVGRRYGDVSMLRTLIHRILIPAALLASFVGIYQSLVGIPFWQEAYLKYKESQGFIFRVGTGTRSFGFSTAPSEYGNLLLLACFFCLIGAFAGRKVLYLPLVVLLPALFLNSSRGPILHLLVAAAMGYAFKSRNKAALPLRLALALVVAFGGLALAVRQQGDVQSTGRSSAANAEIAHQVNGLAHPLDSKYSTAGNHMDEIKAGALTALRHPIGFGTSGYKPSGSTDIGDEQGAAEFDVIDTFLMLGYPGGLAWVSFIVVMLGVAYRYLWLAPMEISLPLFAMLIPQIGAWTFLNEYGNAALFFFILGTVVRGVYGDRPAAKRTATHAAVSRQLPQPRTSAA